MVQATDKLISTAATRSASAISTTRGRYHSHSVFLEDTMNTAIPLELQHLNIKEEYNKVVGIMTAAESAVAVAAMCGMAVFFLAAVGSFIGMWATEGGDSGGVKLLIPGGLLVAALCCGGVKWLTSEVRIADVRAECRAANKTLSSKKVEFSVTSKERSTGRHTTTTDYYLVVKFFVPDTVVVQVPAPVAAAPRPQVIDYGSAAVTPSAPPAPKTVA